MYKNLAVDGTVLYIQEIGYPANFQFIFSSFKPVYSLTTGIPKFKLTMLVIMDTFSS